MKDARRQEAKDRRATAPAGSTGVDRDLDGIVAGPQPLAEWQVEGLAQFEDEDKDEAAEETGDNG